VLVRANNILSLSYVPRFAFLFSRLQISAILSSVSAGLSQQFLAIVFHSLPILPCFEVSPLLSPSASSYRFLFLFSNG